MRELATEVVLAHWRSEVGAVKSNGSLGLRFSTELVSAHRPGPRTLTSGDRFHRFPTVDAKGTVCLNWGSRNVSQKQRRP